MRQFLLYHLLPIVVVGIIVSAFWQPALPTKVAPLSFPKLATGHYTTFGDNGQEAIDLTLALQNPHTLVVMGSSELTRTLDNHPFRFIPEKVGAPVFAVGRGGTQLDNIIALLLANHDKLMDSKVSIMVSPSWFETRSSLGTSLPIFLEFNSTAMLEEIYTADIPAEFKQQVGNYLFHHLADLNNAHPVHRLLAYEFGTSLSAAYAPFSMVYRGQHANSNDDFIWSPDVKPEVQPQLPTLNKVDWDGLRVEALKDKMAISDERGVSEEFLDYVPPGAFKKVKPVAEKFNAEWKSYQVLLALLNHYKVEASLVIHPLNAKVYDNLETMDELVIKLDNMGREAGFPVLNLYVSSPEDYDTGLLDDAMHMSNYGWLHVNQFLVNSHYEN